MSGPLAQIFILGMMLVLAGTATFWFSINTNEAVDIGDVFKNNIISAQYAATNATIPLIPQYVGNDLNMSMSKKLNKYGTLMSSVSIYEILAISENDIISWSITTKEGDVLRNTMDINYLLINPLDEYTMLVDESGNGVSLFAKYASSIKDRYILTDTN